MSNNFINSQLAPLPGAGYGAKTDVGAAAIERLKASPEMGADEAFLNKLRTIIQQLGYATSK